MFRNRSNDLSNYFFSGTDKIAFIEHIKESGLSLFKASKKYNINENRLKDWVKRYNKGLCLHDRSGRPTSIDEDSASDFRLWLMEQRQAQRTPRVKEVKNHIIEAVKKTKRARGQFDNDGDIHRRTIKRFKVSMDCRQGKGQTKTEARIEAEGDIRNAYSMAIMFLSFCSQLHSTMIYI